MRALCLLVALLLAGCSAPAADEPSPTSDAGKPRTGRGSPGSGGNETPHEEVTFFSGKLDALGPGPVTYQAEVPENLTTVEFVLDASQTPGLGGVQGLRVTLEGCGVFDSGGGGYFGGVYYRDLLCATAPAAGPRQARVEAQAMLFQGATFQLIGWRPLNATAAAPQS
jgi:hypothetical protein